MLDEALRHDLRHDLVGVVHPLVANSTLNCFLRGGEIRLNFRTKPASRSGRSSLSIAFRPSARPCRFLSAVSWVERRARDNAAARMQRSRARAVKALRILIGINEPGPKSVIEGSTQALATTAQLRNRRLQQEEISAWLARVEPDNRMTLCRE